MWKYCDEVFLLWQLLYTDYTQNICRYIQNNSKLKQLIELSCLEAIGLPWNNYFSVFSSCTAKASDPEDSGDGKSSHGSWKTAQQITVFGNICPIYCLNLSESAGSIENNFGVFFCFAFCSPAQPYVITFLILVWFNCWLIAPKFTLKYQIKLFSHFCSWGCFPVSFAAPVL